jgi:hypothetical protein
MINRKKRILTEEHKRKISESHKGKILKEETKEKLRSLYLGKSWEEVYGVEKAKNMKDKISKLMLGHEVSQTTKEKISFANRGHSVSEDVREKISKAFKGKTYEEIMGGEKAKERKQKNSDSFSGQGNPFYNKKHNQKTKEIMSSLRLGKSHEEIMGKENAEKWLEKMSGKNHPFWKGGYYIKDYKNFTNRFKNIIRKRDNQVCMICGKHREKMNCALPVHHIDYNKHNSILENCIALCIECHAKTNYNRKYWLNLCRSILRDRYEYDYENVIIEIRGKYK